MKMDAAGVPLEASLSVGMGHRNIVRTIAWVVDRSRDAEAAPGSAPTSRTTSNELPEGCAYGAAADHLAVESRRRWRCLLCPRPVSNSALSVANL